MAFGGGSRAVYQADLVIQTDQAVQAMQALSGQLSRAMGVVGRNLRANLGQSIREVDRDTVKLSGAIKNLEAKSGNLFGAASKSTNQALQKMRAARAVVIETRTALKDLQLQGKATSTDLQHLATTLDSLGQALPKKQAGIFKETASNIRARVAESPGYEPVTMPLSTRDVEQAAMLDSIKRVADIKKINERVKAANAQYVADAQQYQQQVRVNQATYTAWWDQQIGKMQAQADAAVQAEARRVQGFKAQNAKAKANREQAIQDQERAWQQERRIEIEREALYKRLLSSNAGMGKGDKGGNFGGSGSGSGSGSKALQDDGKIRGQLMPKRSQEAAKAMLLLSSASQGAMLAIAALDGNVVGLGFSLIFLGYGIVSVALAAAALTAAITVVKRLMSTIITEGAKAGAAMEKLGQQMSSFFKDQARSQKVLTQASGLSRQFGIDPEVARQSVFELEKVGMASQFYMETLANAAAATGKDMADVTDRWVEIAKASAEERAGLMESFAKDFDIENKKYVSSLELAEAVQTRFSGAAAARASTQIGLVARIKATWIDFATSVGSVLQGYFKPALEVALAFVTAMTSGFQAAKKTGENTGDLQKSMRDFAGTMRALIPYMERFGYIMGKVVYYALLVIARIAKVVADSLIRLWSRMKPVVDFARAMAQGIKELIGWLVAWYNKNKDIIDIILTVIGGLLAFEVASRLLMGSINLLTTALSGAWAGVKALGEILANTNLAKVVKLGIEGVDAALSAIASVAQAMAGLASKGIGLAVTGVEGAVSGIKRVADELGKLANKSVTVTTTNVKETVNTTSSSISGGIGKALTASLPGLSIIIAQGLRSALSLAAANPLITLGIAAVAAVILAGIFPRETGKFSKIFLDNVLAVFVKIVALPVLITARLIDAFIDVFAEVVYQVGVTVKNLFTGLFDIVKDTVAGVLGGLKDLIVGIITGDWERAMDGALKVLDTLFIDLPMHLFTLFFDEAKRWIEDVFPRIADLIWTAFKDIFEAIYDIVKVPLDEVWDFFENWLKEFSGGWASEQWDKLTGAVDDVVNDIWEAFKDIFDFRGSKSLKNAVVTTFDGIKSFLETMLNPFEPILGWLQAVIDKAGWVKDAVNAVLPGNPLGGGGGGDKPERTRIPAKIISWQQRDGDDKYVIAKSRWSDEPEVQWVVQTDNLDLSKYTHGGIVPGRRGQRVPVLAEAGEMFLGHPDFAQGSGRVERALGASGGDTHVYFDLRGSAVGDEGLKKLAQTVASSLVGNLAGNRAMTFHRIGG